MTISIRKCNTKDGKRFNNYVMLIDDVRVGIIGKSTFKGDKYIYISQHPSTTPFEAKTFDTITEARKFFTEYEKYLNN